MILWLFILLDLVAAVAIGCFLQGSPLEILGSIVGIYFILNIFSFLAATILSVWLGRSGQWVLRETSYYPIDYYTDEKVALGFETVARENITSVTYSAERNVPTLEVKRYTLGGWRDRWLMPFCDTRWEYNLILPYESEV